jgi:hypothetical protein
VAERAKIRRRQFRITGRTPDAGQKHRRGVQESDEAGSGGVVIRKLPFYGGPGGVFEDLLGSPNPVRFNKK